MTTRAAQRDPADWDDVVAEAEEKYKANELDGEELSRLQNLRDCAYNRPWATNCP